MAVIVKLVCVGILAWLLWVLAARVSQRGRSTEAQVRSTDAQTTNVRAEAVFRHARVEYTKARRTSPIDKPLGHQRGH